MAFKPIKRELYGGDIELIFSPNARNRYLVNDKVNNQTVNPSGVTTILNKVLAKEALMLWPMRMALAYVREYTLELTDQFTWNLEECLEQASKAHVKKSTHGKDVGSEVHERIENFLLVFNKPEERTQFIGNDSDKPFMAFVDWCNRAQPKVLATEQIVFSREHNYAGTFDALLEIDGKVVLADIKTTNASQDAPLGIYPENFLQLGAYAQAWNEENERELPVVAEYVEEDGTHVKEYGKGDSIFIDDLMVINCSKTGKLSTLSASDLGLSVSDCEGSWLQVLNTYKFMEPLKKQIKEWKGDSNG